MAEEDLQAQLNAWQAYYYPETYDPRRRTGTMRNLAGIRNPDLLREYEYAMTAMRATQLHDRTVEIPRTFDAGHLQAIHRHLFQDVYEWAGTFRTVDMQKGTKPFALTDDGTIARHLQSARRVIERTPWQTRDRHIFAASAATVFAHLNEAHPFREGNGRTNKIFLAQVAELSRYTLDVASVDRATWNLASQTSRPRHDPYHPRPEKLTALFEQLAKPRDHRPATRRAPMPPMPGPTAAPYYGPRI